MKFHKPLLAAAAVIIIAGCENAGGGLSINSVNGTVDLSTLYADQAPVCASFFGVMDIYAGATVVGNSITSVTKTYSSTDGSCTGETASYETTISYTNDGSVDASWDGTAPTKADVSGSLADPVSASKLTATVEADNTGAFTAGQTFKNIVFIDDTDSANGYVVYNGTSSGGTSADGYPLLLSTVSGGSL